MVDLEEFALDNYDIRVERTDVAIALINRLDEPVNKETKTEIAESLWGGSTVRGVPEEGSANYHKWIAHKVVVFAMIDEVLGQGGSRDTVEPDDGPGAIVFSGRQARLS